MHKPSYRASIVGIFLVSVILIFPEVTEAQKLVVGWSAVSALNSPYWVIKDAGFAKQEGWMPISFTSRVPRPWLRRSSRVM